jgi:hypothetical protein
VAVWAIGLCGHLFSVAPPWPLWFGFICLVIMLDCFIGYYVHILYSAYSGEYLFISCVCLTPLLGFIFAFCLLFYFAFLGFSGEYLFISGVCLTPFPGFIFAFCLLFYFAFLGFSFCRGAFSLVVAFWVYSVKLGGPPVFALYIWKVTLLSFHFFENNK